MRVLCEPKIIVQAHGKDMIGSLVVIPSENRNDIVHMIRNVEQSAAASRRLLDVIGYAVDPGIRRTHSAPVVSVCCLNRE